MENGRCAYHDDLVKDVTEVKTNVEWLVKREEEKAANWKLRNEKIEKKKESVKTFWTWFITSLIAIASIVVAIIES